MSYNVTKYGKPLDKFLYVIDEKNKTFSSKENNLVLDFGYLDGWSFKTYSDCTFKIGSYCTFNTRNNCTFNIYGNFNKIKTGGNSTVLIRDKKIHAYLEEEIEIYFENNEIFYTENKLTKDKYLMMEELMK